MDDHYEKFLDDWAKATHHKDQVFIKDGIINPTKWSEASPKVLFINKEAYDRDGAGFDQRDLIRESPDRLNVATHRTIAYWAYAIHMASRAPSSQFPDWRAVPEEECNEYLLSSAMINIKKSNGKSISNPADLKEYVERDGDRIYNQVNLINPDIVVCGHVWWLIKDLWPDAVQVYDSVLTVENRVIVDFWHPAHHAEDQMKYYALAALMQNSGVLAKYAKH